jgi:hypothetical protein
MEDGCPRGPRRFPGLAPLTAVISTLHSIPLEWRSAAKDSSWPADFSPPHPSPAESPQGSSVYDRFGLAPCGRALAAIRSVHSGRCHVPPEVAARLARRSHCRLRVWSAPNNQQSSCADGPPRRRARFVRRKNLHRDNNGWYDEDDRYRDPHQSRRELLVFERRPGDDSRR